LANYKRVEGRSKRGKRIEGRSIRDGSTGDLQKKEYSYSSQRDEGPCDPGDLSTGYDMHGSLG